MGLGLLALSVAACQWLPDFAENVSSTAQSEPVVTSTIVVTQPTELSTATLTPRPSPKPPTAVSTRVIRSTPTLVATEVATSETTPMEQFVGGGIWSIGLQTNLAKLKLTDTEGKQLGYDPESGTIFNEFSATDTRDSDKFQYSVYVQGNERAGPEILMVPPPTGPITITLTGIDNGEYRLLASFSSESSGIIHQLITGTITAGQIEIITLDNPSQ